MPILLKSAYKSCLATKPITYAKATADQARAIPLIRVNSRPFVVQNHCRSVVSVKARLKLQGGQNLKHESCKWGCSV